MGSDALVDSISKLLSMDMDGQRAALQSMKRGQPKKEVPEVSISRASTCDLSVVSQRIRGGGSDMSDSCSDPGSVDTSPASPTTPTGAYAKLSLAASLAPPGLEGESLSAPPGLAPEGEAAATTTTKEVCTLKIKNLPRRCTQAEILKAVDDIGYGSGYDFFFLPVGPQSKQNRGYAFMNFRDPVTAASFKVAFSGHRIREKAVEVVPAPVQGLMENMMRYSKTTEKAEGNPKVLVLSL